MNWILSLALFFLAASAHAQEAKPYAKPERLSDRGRILIAGQLGGWWTNRDDWRVHLDPSASYFVSDHVALGGYLGYSDRRGALYGRERDYSLGLQAVGDVSLGERVSWFAIAKVGYSHRRGGAFPFAAPVAADQNGLGFVGPFQPPREHLMTFGLFLPFVYQLNEHVGIGFGPDVGIDWPPSDYYSIDVRLGLSTWIPISI